MVRENKTIIFVYVKINLCLGSVTISTEDLTSSNTEKTLNPGDYFGLTPAYFAGKARARVKAKTHFVSLYTDKTSIEETIAPIICEIERISQAYHGFINLTQDDDSQSSIPRISGENPQQTRRLRLELAGKCQQFDAGIRLSGLTGSCRFRLEPEIRSPDPFTGILLP
jgi:hypothetical protein